MFEIHCYIHYVTNSLRREILALPPGLSAYVLEQVKAAWL